MERKQPKNGYSPKPYALELPNLKMEKFSSSRTSCSLKGNLAKISLFAL